jgi:hypothetical protein
MKLDRETLLRPPFAENPPFKVDVDEKMAGAIAAVAAAVGLAGGAQALIFYLGIASVYAQFLGTGGTTLAIIVVLVEGIAEAMVVYGGFRMFQGQRSGREIAVYGLAIDLVAHLIPTYDYSPVGVGALVSYVVIVAVYYLLVVSRPVSA